MKHIYDALVGLAYGDSLGMPVEMWPRECGIKKVGRVEQLLPGQPGNLITSNLVKGEITDDTHISMVLCQQLIEEGDIIKIDIPNNSLNVDVSDEELAKRKEKWQPREPKITDGYLRRYAALVTSGNRGAVLDVDQLK